MSISVFVLSLAGVSSTIYRGAQRAETGGIPLVPDKWLELPVPLPGFYLNGLLGMRSRPEQQRHRCGSAFRRNRDQRSNQES